MTIPDARSGFMSSSAAFDHSEVPVARSSVRVVIDRVAPPLTSSSVWSCLQASPSGAGPLVCACGPRRPPARRTLLVPAEAGAPGVATPLRSSLTFAGQTSSGRALRERRRLGFLPFPARPSFPCGWGRSSPRPGSVSSWAAGSTNRLVSRSARPARLLWVATGTCSGRHAPSVVLVPLRGWGREGWAGEVPPHGLFRVLWSAPLGFPLEARVLLSGVGGAIARSSAVEYEVGPFPAGCLAPGRIDSKAFIHRRVRSVRLHCWRSNALSFHGLFSPSRPFLHRRVGGRGPVPGVSIRSFPFAPSSSLAGSTRDAVSRPRCRGGRP